MNKPQIFKQQGFSLTELVVSSVLISLVVLASLKGLSYLLKTTFQTTQRLDGIQLGKIMGEKLKGLPLDDLRSIDSENTNPPLNQPLAQVFGGTDAKRYLQKWDLSPSSPTFYAMRDDLLKSGFSRYTVQVTCMVRISDGGTGSREWTPDRHFVSHTRCDRDVDDLCFKDLDADGQFWGRGETPQVNLKAVSVSLYDKKDRVIRKEVFVTSSSGLTPQRGTDSAVELRVEMPGRILPGTLGLKPHLEYKSLFGLDYGAIRYTHVHDLDYARLGTLPLVVNQSKKWEYVLTDPSKGLYEREHTFISWPGTPNSLGNFDARVETTMTGEIEVFPYIDGRQYVLDAYGDPLIDPATGLKKVHNPPINDFGYDVRSDPNMPPFVTIPLTRQSGADRDTTFMLNETNEWKRVQDLFLSSSFSNTDEIGYIIFRKKENGHFSNPVWNHFVWDVHPPVVSSPPVTGVHQDGLSPLIEIGVHEHMGNWMHGYDGTQGFFENFFGFIIKKDGVEVATCTWDSGTPDYAVYYDFPEPTYALNPKLCNARVRLVDAEQLPSVLPGYGDYELTFEFCDRQYLKNWHTWTMTLAEGDPSVPFEVEVSTYAGTWSGFFANENNSAALPTVIPRGVRDLGSVLISHGAWGVRWKDVSLWDCDTATGLDCKEILRDGGVRPGGKKYGEYFSFGKSDFAKTRLSRNVTYDFQTTGDRVIKIKYKTWEPPYDEKTVNVWYLRVNN